jgi:hypothetical protein
MGLVVTDVSGQPLAHTLKRQALWEVIVTDVSGQPLAYTFKSSATGIRSYRRFGTTSRSHLQESSAMGLVVTDVSGQPIGHTFKSQVLWDW